MAYLFYLDKTLLPVTPSKLTIKVNNQNKTMNLINDGEINIIKQAGLTDIDFEALIPWVKYPFASYKDKFVSQKTFLKAFEKLKTNKKPFQFIVTRDKPDGKNLYDTDIKVTLESYTIHEDVKNGMDLVVSFKLKQYKEYGTNKIVLSSGKATVEKNRTSDKDTSTAKTHTVVKGDCLWAIAKKYYGDGSKYTKIYKANQELIDKRNKGKVLSKYTIYSGQKLTIPSLS